MLATYHNHSRWSDGKATLEEIYTAARRMGIAELGVSDHWVLHPSGRQQTWAMPTEKLADYVHELTLLRDLHAEDQDGPVVRIGVEADWHPGQADRLNSALRSHPFDYVLGSVHEVGDFVIDMSPANWEKTSQAHRNALHRQYWINVKSLAESGVFDIVAHLDLAKKFGFYATIDLTSEIDAALDAIARANLVVELNTSGWHKPCADGYPTLEILRKCFAWGIRTTINADAHQPDHLTRDFDKAADRLAAAGYTQIARFAGRKVRMESLADALRTKRSVEIPAPVSRG